MTIGALIATALGLVVGIGGMWLAWRIVRRLPMDDRPSGTEAEDASFADNATDDAADP